jgi:hypothetical protein
MDSLDGAELTGSLMRWHDDKAAGGSKLNIPNLKMFGIIVRGNQRMAL